jgi:hypothetical protein
VKEVRISQHTIPAITVWQPWASLIAAGAKPFEWRRWPAPRRLIGTRIAIHAGARKVVKREIDDLLVDLTFGNEALTSLDVAVARPLLEQWYAAPGSLPRSSVLCLATLGKPITAAQYAQQKGIEARDSDRVDHQLWGWPLSDIEALEPYAPATGAQGFWNWIRT